MAMAEGILLKDFVKECYEKKEKKIHTNVETKLFLCVNVNEMP